MSLVRWGDYPFAVEGVGSCPARPCSFALAPTGRRPWRLDMQRPRGEGLPAVRRLAEPGLGPVRDQAGQCQ